MHPPRLGRLNRTHPFDCSSERVETAPDPQPSGSLAGGGEDPVLMAAGGSLFLYFRSEGHLIEAVLASASSNWDANQIEEANLIHDPRAALDGDKRYAVFTGAAVDDDWHLMTFDGELGGIGWDFARGESRGTRPGSRRCM